jgi:hypothetical protein
MEIAINKIATYAMLAGVSSVFHAQTFAGSAGENIAIQDLPPKFVTLKFGR